ncbi:transmembrane emp24 domain-containing protein 5 isoform X1 [Ixodes scapularis]|uniref:transmembrane emp24 domain-containing protein 5 isoform X1 n=1 Tax=Ixodes scapularis TaxID=6945 RepID=UPI001AD67286|nr:transmembrane emp24 domain-containing protein 5 isoform X1 [Ixodes scapularis]
MGINRVAAAALLFTTLAVHTSADSYISEPSLGTSFEFKLHVDAGKEECFYQNVEAGASVYVAYQVTGLSSAGRCLLLTAEPRHTALLSSGIRRPSSCKCCAFCASEKRQHVATSTTAPRLGMRARKPDLSFVSKPTCGGVHFDEAGCSVVAGVLRGGDGQAGFAVRHPNGQHVLPYQWRPSAEYEETSATTTGFYQLCIDNSMSHFAAKLVSLYFNSFKRDKWESYVQEIEALGVTVNNFTDVLQKVDGQVGEMLKYQDQNRRHMAKDWYIVDGNNRYVQYWSLAQCAIVVLTSTIQVYFVRKLFEVKNVTPTSKPRA